jgi:putative phosphoribosyl transferase
MLVLDFLLREHRNVPQSPHVGFRISMHGRRLLLGSWNYSGSIAARVFDQDQIRRFGGLYYIYMYKAQLLDRRSAGLELARQLRPLMINDAAVFGLPGGGVADEVARNLVLPLFPVCVRKLGIPGHDELSMGAIAPQGIVLLDHGVIGKLDIAESAIQKVVDKEMLELQLCEQTCRPHYDAAQIAGRTAVIIDDAIVDNLNNILVAVDFVRKQQPRQLWIASPLISAQAADRLSGECEYLLGLRTLEI